MKERKGYILYKQEVYSVRVSVHFAGENMLCSDVDRPETKTLFVIVYYISHIQNGSVEVHFPESDADRKVSLMANVIE